MIVGIDASNLRVGGGVTHLAGLLGAAEPAQHGISRIIVWSGAKTLERLPRREWLTPFHEPWLDRFAGMRLLWQKTKLSALAARHCDLLFVPGGLVLGAFRPVVTMSRNILPFDPQEAARFGKSLTAMRLRVLRAGQGRSFQRADGVIFLTEFAKDKVSSMAPLPGANVAVIPHGVDERFRRSPRPARPLSACSFEDPLRILYVSIINRYKHQWHVADAIALLRAQGLPVSLELVGPAEPTSLRLLQKTIQRVDAAEKFIHYAGPCDFDDLHRKYEAADMFVFASSAENMPNILLEAMASGLPIACARRGPMPEVLGDAGEYFDPEEPREIATAIQRLATDTEVREKCALKAYERAQRYSWARCARETFTFLAAEHARVRNPSHLASRPGVSDATT